MEQQSQEVQKQVTLADLNIVQLKAIAYDEVVKLNISQNNLRVINQELFNRQQQGIVDAAPVTQLPEQK
jgi:hypothetical protein